MSTDILLWILGTMATSSVLAAVITGYFNKRRLSADATSIMTKAATGVVELLEAENRRERERFDREKRKLLADWAEERDELTQRVEEVRGELRSEILVRNRKEEDWHEVLQLHAAWDHLAISQLVDAGIEIPDAPPLHPPGHRPNTAH